MSALADDLRQTFPHHWLMGSDGLAEIVSVPLTDAQVDTLRASVAKTIENLQRERKQG